MIILEHNFAARNPWRGQSPTCVNGCPSGFVVASGSPDPDEPVDWWCCKACQEIFPSE